MHRFDLLLLTLLIPAFYGCESSAAKNVPVATASVVDSIVPREEALRRFREGMPSVAALQGGMPSKDQLLTGYMQALQTRDSAALASYAVNRAEFGWLYYPDSPQGLPPYNVEPALMWFLLNGRSERGVRRALAVYGGRKLELLDYDCGAAGSREGANTIWGPCILRWRDERGEVASKPLVSQVLEREGRFKILSYSNDL